VKTQRLVLVIAALFVFCDSAFAKKQRQPVGTVVKWKEVPTAIQQTVQTNANGGKVTEVRQQTVNGIVLYCAEVKGTDGKWSKIYVKDGGALLRTEPDNARNKRKHKPLFGD
jgi:hypothetical protein